MKRDSVHIPVSFGQKAADKTVGFLGSWKFIIYQTIIVICWIAINLVAWRYRWDVYPFILLNLCFSTQAAYASPLILMAGNRSAERDRARDDLEAEEVALLVSINKRQLELISALHDYLITTTRDET